MQSSLKPNVKWWKFDFHAHTPASLDYGPEDSSQKKIKPEDWIEYAMKAKLDGIVVTDHNSGEWIDDLKDSNLKLRKRIEKPSWYRELAIFPGVEITIAESKSRIHLIAVFDPDHGRDNVTSFLGDCGILGGFGDSRMATKASFVETVQKIKSAGGIAIPAHIKKSKGLLHEKENLNTELKSSLDEVIALEYNNVEFLNELENQLKSLVISKAQVAGSDAHKIEDIGRCFCWIKMGNPTIDNLRFALLDPEFFVKNQKEDPNNIKPKFYLSKLSINSMRHCGRKSELPCMLEFSSNFNSIIGGRGTGKSTIVESIRIALRRDKNITQESTKRNLDQFMNLYQNNGVMQEDTEILLEFYRNEKKFLLRWRHNGMGNVLNEDGVDIDSERVGDIDLRFPITIFSQKQIHELSINTKGLLDIIDNSREVNIEDWQSRWNGVKNKFLQLKIHQRDLLRKLEVKTQLKIKLNDLSNDLKVYEQKGFGDILMQYRKFNFQKNALFGDESIFDNLSTIILDATEKNDVSDFPEHLFENIDPFKAEIKSIKNQISTEFNELRKALHSIVKKVVALKIKSKTYYKSTNWYQELKKNELDYQKLIEENKEKNTPFEIGTYDLLNRQRHQIEKELSELNSLQEESESIATQVRGEIHNLKGLRCELFKKREKFIKENVPKNDLISMELFQFGDPSSVERDYRNHIGLGSDKIFEYLIYDKENQSALLSNLIESQKNGATLEVIEEEVNEVKSKTLNISKGETHGTNQRFSQYLAKRVKENPQAFDNLEIWWPDDLLVIKHKSNGKKVNLRKGSAGQKAAAILSFILSYGSHPIIIDQPEDDLDNALITDLIVNEIQVNKDKRQFIIATHNPNIVVNGVSERVHAMKFENGQVQIDQVGDLGDSKIRETICNVMEGGRLAFDKRYKRITK